MDINVQLLGMVRWKLPLMIIHVAKQTRQNNYTGFIAP